MIHGLPASSKHGPASLQRLEGIFWISHAYGSYHLAMHDNADLTGIPMAAETRSFRFPVFWLPDRLHKTAGRYAPERSFKRARDRCPSRKMVRATTETAPNNTLNVRNHGTSGARPRALLGTVDFLVGAHVPVPTSSTIRSTESSVTPRSERKVLTCAS